MGVMLQTFHWDCPRADKKGLIAEVQRAMKSTA